MKRERGVRTHLTKSVRERPRDGLTLLTCKVCQEDCRVDEFWPVQSTVD